MTREEAVRMRRIIEQAMSGQAIDNKTAYEGRTLYQKAGKEFWDGHLVKVSTKIRWGDKLVAAAVDLWANVENDPDHAPELWEEILYKNGYRVLTGPISASNPVKPGECCWENDVLYECVYPTTCVYRPSEYAQGWKVIEQ